MSEELDWWTSPTESESGRLIMVTGRKDVQKFRTSGKYKIRVEITWKYLGNAAGMPDEPTATVMESVQEAMEASFKKDPVAVMTGIYTGDDERNWVFYTTSVHIFGKKINEALAPFDLLPITIYTENDPDWEEYDEMRAASEIN
ncbi:MAG: DUF695 domain-containing protein [Lachnospiraceae bacterium]|nr:DUF695 domain-containing protein [Lachnospiraceae bacterium]